MGFWYIYLGGAGAVLGGSKSVGEKQKPANISAPAPVVGGGKLTRPPDRRLGYTPTGVIKPAAAKRPLRPTDDDSEEDSPPPRVDAHLLRFSDSDSLLKKSWPTAPKKQKSLVASLLFDGASKSEIIFDGRGMCVKCSLA